MKLFVFALFAVALQIAAAVETGTYTCAKDGSTITIAGADVSKTLMYVTGKATTAGCFAPLTGTTTRTGSLSFTYGAPCGVTGPVANTAGDVTIVIYATVLADGTNSGAPDTKHTYKCSYDDKGEPLLSGTETSDVTATETVVTVAPKVTVPTLTLKIVDATDTNKEYTDTKAAAAGTKVKTRVTFDDTAGKYLGLAKIISVNYKSGATTLEVVKKSCTTGKDSSEKNKPMPIGTKPGGATTITTDSLPLKMVMFAPPLSATLTVQVTLAICVSDTDVNCKTALATTCNNKRRRRDVDHRGVIFAYANLTVSVKNENNEKKTDLQPVCAGYTSNTVFYVVVVVLAVLLVITIGVAAYFGAQAKKRVVLAGKDNPVYT